MIRLSRALKIILIFLLVITIWEIFAHTAVGPDHKVKWVKRPYEGTRIEGKSYSAAFLKTGQYIRKYISKKPGSTPEIMDYFSNQSTIAEKLELSDTLPPLLSVAMIGDLMWIWYGWDRFLDPGVLSEFEKHDILLANLETPIDPSRRVSFPIPDHPSYNSPVGLLTSFYSNRKRCNTLTAVSFANNHTLDRGESGALATFRVLDSLGIGHTGTIQPAKGEKPYCLIEKNGIRIGFYGTCWGTNKGQKGVGEAGVRVNVVPGLAPLEPDKIDLTEVASVLRQMTLDSVDFKIVSIHWGFEFEYYPDPVIMDVGHRIVAAGADLIIGSHPHVPQPNEICFLNGFRQDLAPSQIITSDSVSRKALIIYSLGNFCTPMYTKAHRTGRIQSLELYRTSTGKVEWTIPEISEVYNANGRKWHTFRRVRLAREE